MATTQQLRRLGRRLLIVGVLVAAFAALVAPAAQASPIGLKPSQVRVHGTNTVVRPIVRRVTITAPGGFSWSDAGIGAALATVTVVLLAGAIQASRTRRHVPARHA